jgi:hypothetical protein
MTSTEWIKDAPCALPVPTDDSEKPRFIDFHSEDPQEQARAKAVCAECPFRMKCLQKALNDSERWGIHGGVGETELRTMQAINEFGEPHAVKGEPIQCPNCGPGSENLDVIERKRNRTHIKCTSCDLHWWARKNINQKQTNF